MNLTLYKPNRALDLWTDLDRYMENIFEGTLWGWNQTAFPVDVREEENNYVLEAEIPGLTEKDLDIKVDERLLTIASAKEEKTEEKKNGYLIRECKSRQFSRSFVLPKDVNTEGIEAKYANGVLTLNLPKSPEAKPKSITVKVN